PPAAPANTSPPPGTRPANSANSPAPPPTAKSDKPAVRHPPPPPSPTPRTPPPHPSPRRRPPPSPPKQPPTHQHPTPRPPASPPYLGQRMNGDDRIRPPRVSRLGGEPHLQHPAFGADADHDGAALGSEPARECRHRLPLPSRQRQHFRHHSHHEPERHGLRQP